MKWFTTFFLSCLQLSLPVLGYGQTYPFKNYTIENGLPQSTVYHAYQDSKGYLWAGTQGGVCSFDGREFSVWDAQSGLPDNHVSRILESPDGTLWFGHRMGALSYLKNNQLHIFEHPEYNNSTFVKDLLWEKDRLWIASEGDGLYMINFSDSVTTVDHFTVENGLASNILNDLLLHQNRLLYIATREGVSVLDLNERVFSSFSKQEAFNKNINALCQGEDGELWLAASDGLLWLDLKNKADYKTYHLGEEQGSNYISDVIKDAEGNIWLATEYGVAKLGKGQTIRYNKQNGLVGNSVHAIFQDREGAIWISQDDGLSRYNDSPFLIYTQKDGLVNNEVYAIVQYNNTYWIGTAEGISIFDPEQDPGQQFENLTVENGLPDNFVYSLFVDSRENIWIGTIHNGAACYNPYTNRFRYFNKAHGLKATSVVNIGEDHRGRIWFALLDGGLACYDFEKDTLHSLDSDKDIATNSAWSVYKDEREQIWFGTADQGLLYLDTLSDHVLRVPGQEGLSTKSFGSLSSDGLGNIWIGSIGGGLLKYDGKRFSQFGLKQGIKTNNPYFVFCDSANSILLGTNTGLDVFNPYTLNTRHYARTNGFLGIETNQNAVFRDQDKDVWIGTVNGLVRYRASENTEALPAPPVHITKQRLFFKDTVLTQNTELSYQQDYITFDYKGISLSGTERLRYRYLLEGFDREWSPEIREPYVTFTNLPPGNYTFKVKAGYENGEWSQEEASFHFSVMTPYWKQWWFMLLLLAAVFCFFYSFYRYRINQLLKVQKVKNNISADLHDDIGSRLTNIQLLSAISKSKLDAGSGAEANAYLKSIDDEVQASAEALDEIVWNIKMDDENLEDMIARMRRYAAEVLENDQIDYSININKEFFDRKMRMEKRRELFLMFKEVLNNVRKHACASMVDICISIQANRFFLAIRDNGKGFDPYAKTSRNGLINMKERVKKWKGRINICAEIKKGTMIEIWLPFDKKSIL